ncbi:hypothetical protein I7I48_03291 [Histoplasma ohiense]|nr:hypothetical protein I7I48_03291 [Histoplasma ohiense (nom. inval.)]
MKSFLILLTAVYFIIVPHTLALRRVENINLIHNSEKNSNGLISTSDDKNVNKYLSYQPRSHDGFEVHKTYDHLLPSERIQQSAHVLNKLKRVAAGCMRYPCDNSIICFSKLCGGCVIASGSKAGVCSERYHPPQ